MYAVVRRAGTACTPRCAERAIACTRWCAERALRVRGGAPSGQSVYVVARRAGTACTPWCAERALRVGVVRRADTACTRWCAERAIRLRQRRSSSACPELTRRERSVETPYAERRPQLTLVEPVETTPEQGTTRPGRAVEDFFSRVSHAERNRRSEGVSCQWSVLEFIHEQQSGRGSPAAPGDRLRPPDRRGPRRSRGGPAAVDAARGDAAGAGRTGTSRGPALGAAAAAAGPRRADRGHRHLGCADRGGLGGRGDPAGTPRRPLGPAPRPTSGAPRRPVRRDGTRRR